MNYQSALEEFAARGVDAEAALAGISATPLSVHCWQGDDVAGFEGSSGNAGSGCLSTGNHPGKARNFAELSSDLEQVARLVPGPLRVNLHASYATDNADKVDRDALDATHFRSWIDWAKARGWGIDFNPTCFGHPLAADGFTLSHRDAAVRKFWVAHCIACRRIGAEIGRELGNPVVTNIWIPDGYKDTPADRFSPRRRLLESLEAVLTPDVGAKWNIDAVESKLFGIGVESYTVGSHEFYMGLAVRLGTALCLDAGHFHPTESVADKISAMLLFVPSLLLHVSRGVRWDSDHVITLDDATKAMLEEVAVSGAMDRVHIGMDFFDASISRITAWTIGARNTKKALLIGLLRPSQMLLEAEQNADHGARLAIMEDSRSLPWGAVWEEFCRRSDTLPDGRWLDEVRSYERRTFPGRQ